MTGGVLRDIDSIVESSALRGAGLAFHQMRQCIARLWDYLLSGKDGTSVLDE